MVRPWEALAALFTTVFSFSCMYSKMTMKLIRASKFSGTTYKHSWLIWNSITYKVFYPARSKGKAGRLCAIANELSSVRFSKIKVVRNSCFIHRTCLVDFSAVRVMTKMHCWVTWKRWMLDILYLTSTRLLWLPALLVGSIQRGQRHFSHFRPLLAYTTNILASNNEFNKK